MEYIRIKLNREGEMPCARLDEGKGKYVTDEVMLVSETGKPTEPTLRPSRTWHHNTEEMKTFFGYEITEITKEEYWNYANQKMVDFYDDEIAHLQKQLDEKIALRDKAKQLMVIL